MASQGFAKPLRLLTERDYARVFSATAVKCGCPQALLIASPNQLGHARLGLVIAKKHVKLAVHRNRLKRLIRESFRLRQASMPPLDIVVLARKGLADMDNAAILLTLDKQWNRLCKRALEITP